MKSILLIATLLLLPAWSVAAPLVPATLFSNQSTVAVGDPIDLWSQPDEVTWTVALFNNLSTFEVTIDASIEADCMTNPGSFYPVSTMTGATAVLARGIDFTGERCARANFRSKAGVGGVTVRFLPRGYN